MGDIGFVFMILYRKIYKDDEWDRIYHHLIAMAWFNLIVLIVFFLLVIHSIFKEKLGRKFLALLSASLKVWRNK